MNRKIVSLFSILLFASFFIDNFVSGLMKSVQIPLLTSVMEWFSHEITVLVILVIISALFLYEEKKNRFIPALFMSFLAAFFVSYFLKFMIMRPRPFGLMPLDFTIFNIAINFIDYSFPSSHAALAFSVLPVLDREFRKLKYFWIFFSCMIAISRVYLNQHFLSDVIAGGLLGYIIGHFILRIGEKHGIEKILREL